MNQIWSWGVSYVYRFTFKVASLRGFTCILVGENIHIFLPHNTLACVLYSKIASRCKLTFSWEARCKATAFPLQTALAESHSCDWCCCWPLSFSFQYFHILIIIYSQLIRCHVCCYDPQTQSLWWLFAIVIMPSFIIDFQFDCKAVCMVSVPSPGHDFLWSLTSQHVPELKNGILSLRWLQGSNPRIS